jgi:hypothetical protein
MRLHRLLAALFSSVLPILFPFSAFAEGPIVITQQKALAGNVTQGDPPGFPIILSQSGAYVLGSNLTVPANTNGIHVNAYNVDIDMGGFTLSGDGVADFGLMTPYGEGRIHNGFINRFKRTALFIRNSAWVVEDMKITRNGWSAIDANGIRFLTVQNSVIALNRSTGIIAGNNAVIRNNMLSGNRYSGLDCGEMCHVEGNSIDGNLNDGVSVQKGGLILGNTFPNNAWYAVRDTSPFDTGMANNMFINNNSAGTKQIFGGVSVHPNACVGNPC